MHAVVIGQGYQLSAEVNIFEFASRARGVAAETRCLLEEQALLDNAVHLLDEHLLGLTDLEARPPLSRALERWNDEVRGYGGPDKDPWAFDIEIAQDPHGGFYGVILHHSAHDLTVQRLRSEFPLVPYSYWTTAARPASVTEDQWRRRGHFWARTGLDGTSRSSALLSMDTQKRPVLHGRDIKERLESRAQRPPSVAARVHHIQLALVCQLAADRGLDSRPLELAALGSDLEANGRDIREWEDALAKDVSMHALGHPVRERSGSAGSLELTRWAESMLGQLGVTA